MHNKHRKLLTKNPEILIMDSTYKTNRFRMPLLNLVGVTANNKLFYAGSIFMPSETEEDFTIALKFLKKDYNFRENPYPEIFLTDADPAQMKAIKNVFLNAI
jgi:MULE transposase domain